MSLIETIRQVIRKEMKAGLSPPEIGTITESGLQLEGFPYPVPTWWAPAGQTYAPGTRVLVIPLKGGAEFWVEGPAEEQGVSV